jgi:hypothetical protein
VSDIGLIAIVLVAFALAIGLVRVLGALIDSGAPDDWTDEPLDTAASSGSSLSAGDGAP